MAVRVNTNTDMSENSEIIQQLHQAVVSDRSDILRAFISTVEQSSYWFSVRFFFNTVMIFNFIITEFDF